MNTRTTVSSADNTAAELHKEAGNEYFQRKKYEKAIKEYKLGVEFDPSNAKIWSNLSFAYDKIGDIVNSKEAAKKAVEFEPTWTKGILRLAKAQRTLYEFDEWEETMERGLKIHPESREFLSQLRECRAEISKRSHFRSGLLTMPLSGSYEFYGGLKDNQVNRIPQGSSYANLPRPAKSPLMKKFWKKTQEDSIEENDYDHQTATHVIDCFCNHNLLVKWCGSNGFQLEAYIEEEEFLPVLVYALEKHGGHAQTYVQNISLPSHHHFTIDQEECLTFILISRFLKSLGSKIDEEYFVFLQKSFKSKMLELRNYKDVVDADLIRCDLLCNRHSETIFPDDISILAVSLDMAKLYTDSAYLHLDNAEGLFGIRTDYLIHWETFRGEAAASFEKATNLIAAEREYLSLLRAAPQWAFEDFKYDDENRSWPSVGVRNSEWRRITPTNMIFVALTRTLNFYSRARLQILSGLKSDSAHQELYERCIVVIGLLAAAEFTPRQLWISPHRYLKFVAALKTKYAPPKRAQKALKHAISSQSIEDFHEVLMRCRASKAFTDPDDGRFTSNQVIAMHKKKTKELTRSVWGAACSRSCQEVISQHQCDQCRQFTSEIKFCPCQKAKYCSRTCQVDHFSLHKKTCSHQKSRPQPTGSK